MHELRRLVDHDHQKLSVTRQCKLLRLTRSTLYYKQVPLNESTLRIMAGDDALNLEDHYSGSRRIVEFLAEAGGRAHHQP